MKDILFKNWHLMRWIRLGMGIAVIIMALQQHQILLAVIGGWFSLMALLNTGCSADGCDYRPRTGRSFNENRYPETIESEKQ